jgi:hypothetical protein
MSFVNAYFHVERCAKIPQSPKAGCEFNIVINIYITLIFFSLAILMFFKMCFTKGVRYGHHDGCFMVSNSLKNMQHREEYFEVDQQICNPKQKLRTFLATIE